MAPKIIMLSERSQTQNIINYMVHYGLPWGLSGKELSCNADATADVGSVPGSGRSPGGRRGNPLQYPCMENAMERGAWQATVHRITKS